VTRAWLLRRLVGDGRRHGAAWLAIAAAFAVLAFASAGARLLSRARAVPGPPPSARVVAYLADDLDAAGAAELARVLARLPGVETVRAVSAREGLALLRRELGARAGVIEGVGADLLAPSLEILARPAEASALAFRLRRLHGVADVDLVAEPTDAPAPSAPPGVGLPFAGALGALGALALLAAFALLRARLRVELALWFALGLPRAASARPAAWLATAAGALGAGVGVGAACWAARAWLGTPSPPLRELALGAAGLLALAVLASRLALRIPEAAGAA
jgi:FtsX extracellular domain